MWDLPTGHLIDALRVQSPCTALAFSNTGDFLATAHADSVGVNIWFVSCRMRFLLLLWLIHGCRSNRTLFTHVPTRPVTESELARVQQPTAFGESGANSIEAAYEEVEDEDVVVDGTSSVVERLDEQLTSLSLVPKSRWQTLVQLDLIKVGHPLIVQPKAMPRANLGWFMLTRTSNGTNPRNLPRLRKRPLSSLHRSPL